MEWLLKELHLRRNRTEFPIEETSGYAGIVPKNNNIYQTIG
ncbi:MAG: hypothetical protein SFU98_21775 [Leptospiraceae bacterium]|nr:hypothetical protein [Leptospiraceae bacterium]